MKDQDLFPRKENNENTSTIFENIFLHNHRASYDKT